MSTNEWYDDIDTSSLFWAGTISVIVFVVLVLGVHALYYAWDNYEDDRKQAVEPMKALATLAAQEKDLSEYKRYQAGDKSKIAIPIGKAMEIVGKEISGSK